MVTLCSSVLLNVYASNQVDWTDTATIMELDRQLAQCPINNAHIATREAEFQEFLREDNLRSPGRRSFYSRLINVPVFQQEFGHWCGPATAQQVIHFRNSSAPSQSALATGIGTSSNGSDVHLVGREINRHTRTTYAGGNLSGNRNIWVDQIRFSIHRQQPALISIRTTNIPAFPYNSEGHIVNVSGYDIGLALNDDLSTYWVGAIRITDPFGPGLGNRWYDLHTLFNAHVTNRYPRPYMAGRASW